MFRSLIVNTAISALAYLTISLVGLIVVPVLLNAYGLTLFGLIALARVWMPTGALGLLDLGVGDTATQTVARARPSDDWVWAYGQLAALTVIALTIGLAAGVSLHLGAETIARLLNVPGGEALIFSQVLRWTALFLPLLFVGLVAEGIVKGFEDYRTVRAIEVFASLLYGGMAILIALGGGVYQLIAYAALGANVARAIAALLAVWRCLRTARFEGFGQLGVASVFCECWRRTRLMAANRLLSTLQVQAAAPLVGVFVGPAGVAVYDILVRLPRFAKSVLGLINSAVLPFAARLEAAARTDELRLLGSAGLPIVAAVTMPPLVAAAAFSRPLLAVWLGPSLVDYWRWQSLMFAVPLMTVLVSFGATALMSRQTVLARLNRYLAIQFGLQLAVSLALVGMLAERAFIAGQLAAVAMTFFWQMRLVFREQSLGMEDAKRLATIMAVGGALAVAVLPLVGKIDGFVGLVGGGVAFVSAYWLLLAFLLLDRKQRASLLNKVLRRKF